MAKKLSERKTSKLVVDTFLKAYEPFKHLSVDEVENAKAEFRRQQLIYESRPEHIKVILKLGVKDAFRGYTDSDLASLIAAEDLADRETRSPGDFVSCKTFSSTQSDNATKLRPNAQTRTEKLKEIGAWLANKNYRESDDKSALIDSATIRFKCGETDVRDAARYAQLTRTYKQSTK